MICEVYFFVVVIVLRFVRESLRFPRYVYSPMPKQPRMVKGSGSYLISGSCLISGELSFSRLIHFELGGSARAVLHAAQFCFSLP